MRKYLVLEDNQEYVDQNYKTAERDAAIGTAPFTLVFATTVDEARKKLATERFSGAILDLRLQNAGAPEGNEVAKQIHRDYFMPMAIVTGFPGELDASIRDLTGDNALVKVFNKNELIRFVFDFLLKIEESGLLQIVGPGGELNRMLADIFWKHLGPAIAQRAGQPQTEVDRKRFLRHAVAHILGALQSHELGTWDNYLSDEVYIWPPICANEMTGDLYSEKQGNQMTDRFWMLVTPACDLASKATVGALWHFIRVLPFGQFPSEGKMSTLVAKKEPRYHVLPPTSVFRGGYLDFATISNVPSSEVEARFVRRGSVVEPYWREIVTRLGGWLARQGTPDIDRETLKAAIRAQWSPLPMAHT